MKDRLVFGFLSKDDVKPGYCVEKWCRADDESQDVLLDQTKEMLASRDNHVYLHEQERLKIKSEWGADKERRHGLFQFKVAGEAERVYLAYSILRKEAKGLPVDVLSGKIGFPDIVRSLL